MDEDGKISYHLYTDVGGISSNHIFFDAGDGYGQWRLDTFQLNHKQDSIDISWVTEGDFPFPYSTVTIKVHNKKLTNAVLNGNSCSINDQTVVTPIFTTLYLEFV
jgi:alpha-glucosidase